MRNVIVNSNTILGPGAESAGGNTQSKLSRKIYNYASFVQVLDFKNVVLVGDGGDSPDTAMAQVTEDIIARCRNVVEICFACEFCFAFLSFFASATGC